MPFHPGERVNLRFVGDPETAVLIVGQEGVRERHPYTIANGGLELKSDGGLIAIIQLPHSAPVTVTYRFTDGTVSETGRLRVREPDLQPPPPDAAPENDGTIHPRRSGAV